MKFFIKVWPDNSATLMTEIGQVLWTFPDVEDAVSACEGWYEIHGKRVASHFQEMFGDTRSQVMIL